MLASFFVTFVLSTIELVKTKEKMAEYMNSASLHDQLVRELQARETDLQEALRAKDSQLAVLRVRLEESDRVITEHKRETENLQTERDRYWPYGHVWLVDGSGHLMICGV